MTIKEITSLLKARVLTNEDSTDLNFDSAFSSDMMSDVLAYGRDQALLLTGLLNQQVIRTAEMVDMRCVIFVRGKNPGEDILSLAREKGIAVISTGYGLFTASGILYEAGLRGGAET